MAELKGVKNKEIEELNKEYTKYINELKKKLNFDKLSDSDPEKAAINKLIFNLDAKKNLLNEKQGDETLKADVRQIVQSLKAIVDGTGSASFENIILSPRDAELLKSLLNKINYTLDYQVKQDPVFERLQKDHPGINDVELIKEYNNMLYTSKASSIGQAKKVPSNTEEQQHLSKDQSPSLKENNEGVNNNQRVEGVNNNLTITTINLSPQSKDVNLVNNADITFILPLKEVVNLAKVDPAILASIENELEEYKNITVGFENINNAYQLRIKMNPNGKSFSEVLNSIMNATKNINLIDPNGSIFVSFSLATEKVKGKEEQLSNYLKDTLEKQRYKVNCFVDTYPKNVVFTFTLTKTTESKQPEKKEKTEKTILSGKEVVQETNSTAKGMEETNKLEEAKNFLINTIGLNEQKQKYLFGDIAFGDFTAKQKKYNTFSTKQDIGSLKENLPIVISYKLPKRPNVIKSTIKSAEWKQDDEGNNIKEWSFQVNKENHTLTLKISPPNEKGYRTVSLDYQ